MTTANQPIKTNKETKNKQEENENNTSRDQKQDVNFFLWMIH